MQEVMSMPESNTHNRLFITWVIFSKRKLHNSILVNFESTQFDLHPQENRT